MRYILCLLLICFLGCKSYGLTITPNFKYITSADGLHNNIIRSIYQDTEGFMWFGGFNGLYRYDGTTLKRVFDKLPVNYEGEYEIFSIVEDNRHLWLGTNVGVFIYSLETEKVTPLKVYAANGETLENTKCLVEKDKDGIMWISSYGQGLFTYNIHTRILEDFGSKHKLDLRNISYLHLSQDDKVWFTTLTYMIYCYDKINGQIENYISEKGSYILSICTNPNGTVWYGTMKGLFCINPETGEIEQELLSKSSSDIFLIEDILWNQGKLYVATSKGLHVYDELKNEWQEHSTNRTVSGYINDSDLKTVFIDKQGNLWLGTLYGGVNYYPLSFSNFTKGWHINNKLQTPIVTSFAKDRNDNLWIGTENSGFYFLDRTNDNVISYNSGEQSDINSSYYNIQSLLVDDDYLYVGMQIEGLDILNLRTKEIKSLSREFANFSARNVYVLYKDSDGIVWIGTNVGLYCLDTKTWKIDHIDDVPNDLVFCIAEDKKGRIWICSDNIGVYCYNKKTNRAENFNDIDNNNKLPTDQIRTLTIENNKIYFGTIAHSVYVYDLHDYSFEHLNIENTSDCAISRIILHEEELWMPTSEGLLCYNQIKRTTNKYTVKDGLKGDSFWRSGGIKMNDGMVYIGGSGGLSAFNPSEFDLATQNHNLVLTDFYINNKKVDTHTEDTPLKKSIAYCDTVILKDEQRHFGIEFGILNYTGSTHSKYQYKLEPFEKEWVSANLDDNIVSYIDLPAGEYKFIIRCSNKDGEWEKSDRDLVIKILQPWWWSLSFRFFYILLFILFVFSVFLVTKIRYKRKLKNLEISKEKELYQSKIDFFTTIVHELRTPLTLISVPLDRALKSTEGQGVASDLQMVKRNSERLLTLVNQLLDFRKMEEHAIVINIETVDIKSLLNKICQEFKLSTEIGKKSLYIELPIDVCYAKIDKEAYIKIITNILSNALKFTKDTIIVKLDYNESRTKWKISIIDNGNGIPELEQQQIFKPFYQVQEDRLSDNIGTGIGLSVVAKLVSLLNGKIEVKSQIGEGAEFILFFDASEPSSVDFGVKEYKEDKCCNSVDIKGGKTSVLIVEDNLDMRTLLLSILDEKFIVHSTVDGLSALEKMKQHSFDLVISDIMMPQMDGLELCKHIKADINTSHIPVILLTAKASEDETVEGLETGADIYIKKPFSQKILISQIYSLLRNREKLFINYREKPEVELQSITNTEADKDFINKLNQFIEDNLDNSELSVNDIYPIFLMSRSAFFAKVKGVSGMTPNDYIRTIRLKRAVQYFMKGESYINEVAYKVGFSSQSHFGKCFLKQFNQSPSNFIKNHLKE